MSSDDEPRPGKVDHLISALHAWLGDHLAESRNPLHAPMAFYQRNRPVAPAALAPSGKVCVLVHGLGNNESVWRFPARHAGGSYGDLLRERFGYTPLYVRYNTGQRISTSGRELAALLRDLCAAHPVDELLLIGHSMGGLAIRSACHQDRDAAWPALVRHIVYLGSPHLGAPLEKAANLATHLLGRVDTTATLVIRDVVNSRSAGVKDLRFGNLLDDDWLGSDPDELLRNRRVPVPWLATARHHRVVGHAVSAARTLGDAVVRPLSAAAAADHISPGAPRPEDVLEMPGLNHLALAQHPSVFEHIAGWVVDDG